MNSLNILYGVCLLRTRTPKLCGATFIGENAWQNILYSAFHFQKLLFQVFLPITHLIGCSWSAVYRSHLTPSKSSSWGFWEIIRHGQKKLKRLQEIVKKVYHDKDLTRMHMKTIFKGRRRRNLWRGGESEIPERKGFHRRYHRRSGEWPVGECHETRSGPWHFDSNSSWHSPQWSAALKKVGLLSDQNGLLWDEEGAIQDNEMFTTINAAVSWQSQRTFSMLVSSLGVKRELAGLILTREAS